METKQRLEKRERGGTKGEETLREAEKGAKQTRKASQTHDLRRRKLGGKPYGHGKFKKAGTESAWEAKGRGKEGRRERGPTGTKLRQWGRGKMEASG